MPRILQQPAYVLHARAYRETSLLLDLLTREHGRTALVARGARGAKSRWRNVLQPFRPLLLSWSSRSDLGTLTSADQVAAPPSLHGEALYCGLYLNELLVRLLHRGDPHPEVFERYRQVLADLSAGGDPQPLLRVFEKNLLEAVGYGLMLEQDFRSGEALRADAMYDYRPDRGPVRVSHDSERRERLVAGSALLALKAERPDADSLPDLRRMMRRVIGYHLGDKPLASTALFGGPARNVRSQSEPPE